MPFFGVPIRNGLPIGLGSSAGFGVQPFDPSYLFAAGEQGFFYDPSDLSTLFQDSAGTTPVTGVEQVVGLMLDKSGNANNATSTGAARPTLSARVNLLTKTEQFDDGAWITDSRLTISANTIDTTDPLGGNTADKATETIDNGTHRLTQSFVASNNTNYTFSFYAKKGTRQWVWCSFNRDSNNVNQFFDLDNIVTGSSAVAGTGITKISASITDVGNGWRRCEFIVAVATPSPSPGTAGGPFFGLASADGTASYAGDTNQFGYFWGADLRVSNDGVGIPAYQRVNTATDYDSSGFPLYLRFGGTQAMSTGSIDFTATDKMSVFAGVRKLSDAATAVLAELSATSLTNNGSFTAFAPDNPPPSLNAYSFASRGTTRVFATLASGPAAPITNTFTGTGDISGDSVILRIDGAQVASSTSDQGTGNFGNYPLYIGARNLASLFLNGRIYSLIGVGSAVSAGNISATESWVNGRTKAF